MPTASGSESAANPPGSRPSGSAAPHLSLPKGGGAIRGIGEKFVANPVRGTGGMTVPVVTSPGRSSFAPQLGLSYDSGAANGSFGFGWGLALPSITRKTQLGLPQYRDAEDSDVFILSGAEDLVPVYRQDASGDWLRGPEGHFVVHEDQIDDYRIRRFRPRVEGLFARLERWTRLSDPRDVHWRSFSRDDTLTVYGRDTNSRIAAADDPGRIFSWLISETRDDKGNVILYRYKAENGDGVDLSLVSERNRGPSDDTRRAVNRYIKHIYYGNHTPLLDASNTRPRFLDPKWLDDPHPSSNWMFEVVFDYGEHDPDTPTPLDSGTWLFRPDPFSSYRSAFEIRTTRRCRRVLMFHHFEAEEGVGLNCLVRSTDFTFSDERAVPEGQQPVYSFLQAVAQTGYRRSGAGYTKKSLPPVEFEYTQAAVEDLVHDMDPESLENLPVGLDGSKYRWIDLHGEGIPGILTEQADAWFYKRNLSPLRPRSVELAPLECVAKRPNLALTGGAAQLMDLAGDGTPDLVVLEGTVPGFYRHGAGESWEAFRPFESVLNRNLRDPNTRFIDLDGDGIADVLITEDEAFVWHPSLAEEGYGPARRLTQPRDDELGPRLVFADGTDSVYLADMSGDGLTDLVRVRNGEVCYWPNLGYGHFGAKITMDDSPWFDNPDQFDQKRVRLADIDGSGTIDLIYLHSEGIRLYFNRSGNSWSAARALSVAPNVDDLVSITPADLFGNGTSCLVWSSPLPGDTRRQMRFIKLMGDRKPHLLVEAINNVGAQTHIEYSTSTKFYLQDRRDGKPWVTKLPFPVHVVEKVETVDHISRHRFVTRYAYHHGYFDALEREFRGFGMVEQWDSEAYEDYLVGVRRIDGAQEQAPEFNQPPVTTRTWHHTGAFLSEELIFHQYQHEYYRGEQLIPKSILPPGLSLEELREAVRALTGLTLRQEIYSFDGSPREQNPYTVVENNFEIRCLQPRGQQRHGVFFRIARESLSCNYERDPTDPRITHSFGLELDSLGNTRKSCSVVYGRRTTNASLPAEVAREQQKQHITYAETDYTPDIDQGVPTEFYRTRTSYESRAYEITGVTPNRALFQFSEIRDKIAGTAPIDYEVIAAELTPQRRLLSHSRSLFMDNALNPLPLGQWDSLGLGYQTYTLAFTPGVLTSQYTGKVSDADLIAAGYVHFNADTHWWIPSGTAIYPANPAAHFYLTLGARDPLGLESSTTLDRYDLLVEKVELKQATWNVITAVNDYRILGPVLVTDPNANRSAIEPDELGLIVKTAILGKAGSSDGDSLADPTTRMEYELFNWKSHRKPNYVHTFVREQHGPTNPRWQESYVHSNGSGAVAMVKAQAHPGKAFRVEPDGTKTEVDANPRWVGNGRTILNNKGKPVKQYEPYFSTTYEYEDEQALREIGVTPLLSYDAIGRNIRTDHPNGTFAKIEFDSWLQKVFDANDTVRASRWYAERGSPDPATQPEPLNDPERRAAWLTAKHADTPSIIHFDSLGRAVFAISDYGSGKTAAVRSETDLTGRLSKVFDQQQRPIASGFTGMAGTPMTAESAEKGRRWTFPNVLGALVKSWDEHGRQLRAEYDTLHRPISTFVQEAAGTPETLFQYIVFGDRAPNAQQSNLLGAAHQVFDSGGVLRITEIDFQGNPGRVERVLAKSYTEAPDWSALATQTDVAAVTAAAAPSLELSEVFVASARYDALNRPTEVTLPDGTVMVPSYNEANFLASLRAQIRGQGNPIAFLEDQDYDAKGQRQFAHHGNDVLTRYFYDPNTFRLTGLLTHAPGADPKTQALQDLHYTYDPVGNVTQTRDDAQQTHYFRNAVVQPESLYEYDALYQLIRATGRELAGATNDSIRTSSDLESIAQLPHANDTSVVRTYTEQYEYDLLGNLRTFKHLFKAQPGIGSGWTRQYHYAVDDDPADRTNRLKSTSLPGDPNAGPYSATYGYDAYGNMTSMPSQPSMSWNAFDQLRQIDLGGGGTAHYVYGSGGQRLRKVIERNGDLTLEWIYLGAVMIFRRRRRSTRELRLERWTVHISDANGPIAQVDTKTLDEDGGDPTNPLNVAVIRYGYSNHLGSAVLETDETGNPISYEEYHPFGTTAYRSAKSGVDASLKRFRFSGKERDAETGLYYFGLRYYAPWLGRWTSSDPLGFADGLDLFTYCRNNPIRFSDAMGGLSTEGNIVNIGKPDEATIRDLHTDTDDARTRLEQYYQDKIYPSKDHPGDFVALVPGSLKWNPQKKQNWGVFATIEVETVVVHGTRSGHGHKAHAPKGDSAAAPAPPPAKPPSPPNTGLLPVPGAVKSVAQEALRPTSVTGARPRGTMHLWSGDAAKAEARAAIDAEGSGWMMGEIKETPGTKGAPTPEHAAAEPEFAAARARAPGGTLTKAEMDQIWGWRSASVTGRAAFSGHPVQGHGPTSTEFGKPGYIQGHFESPARAIGGGLAGGMFIGSGLFTAITGGQDPNPAVGIPLVLSGVGEATGGIIYGSGAIAGDAAAMAIGGAVGTAFGGAGAAIGFGVASYRSFEAGDTTSGVVDALGAIGGVLLVASLFTPVGWVALAGVALVAFAGGYNLAGWLSSR